MTVLFFVGVAGSGVYRSVVRLLLPPPFENGAGSNAARSTKNDASFSDAKSLPRGFAAGTRSGPVDRRFAGRGNVDQLHQPGCGGASSSVVSGTAALCGLHSLSREWIECGLDSRPASPISSFRWNSIDDRDPWAESPAMWLEVYRWYDTAFAGPRNILLITAQRRLASRAWSLSTCRASRFRTIRSSGFEPADFLHDDADSPTGQLQKLSSASAGHDFNP